MRCEENCCPVNTCLGLCSLEYGVLTIGGLSVACYLGVFLTILTLTITNQTMGIHMFFLLLSAFIILVSSILMVYGVCVGSRGLIRQWVVLQVLVMFIFGLALIVAGGYIFVQGNEILGAGLLVLCFLFFLTYSFSVMVVYNYNLTVPEIQVNEDRRRSDRFSTRYSDSQSFSSNPYLRRSSDIQSLSNISFVRRSDSQSQSSNRYSAMPSVSQQPSQVS